MFVEYIFTEHMNKQKRGTVCLHLPIAVLGKPSRSDAMTTGHAKYVGVIMLFLVLIRNFLGFYGKKSIMLNTLIRY